MNAMTDTSGSGAVAVVGMACRFPGAPDPDAFWRLLRDGRHAISEPPSDRTGMERPGGYLERVGEFDPDFFSISPREARAMDPQQRLVLELAWEALEDAGIVPGTLTDGGTGVFVGAIRDDYATLTFGQGERSITPHTLVGTNRGIIANRVSHVLGLRGPSITLDTAQSSSLVAVHHAAESVRRGEAPLAIAGGVNLNLAPSGMSAVEEFGGLSPDHRCFTFDARANGYVRGEGGGLVVLKPLARALEDGDRVYCVILGGAVNNDGTTSSLVTPSARGQAEVIRAACHSAGVAPAALQYVELHGTGTKVGDPVEAAALGEAAGSGRPDGVPLLVGSAKTNVGHLEGAAGIVGFIKTALSVRHRRLPPSLNFERPNPAIDLAGLGLRVQQTLDGWPRPDSTLLAGVSSFGMGGTDCHIVVGEPPAGPARSQTRLPAVPWMISARSPAALTGQAASLSRRLRETEAEPAEVAWSLATTRTMFAHRAVIVGSGKDELLDGIEGFANNREVPGLVRGTARDHGGVVLVFPGQGSQWAGMAKDLRGRSAVFRDSMDACSSALAPYIAWSLWDVLEAGPGAPSIDRDVVVQPLLFSVMVSLARMWEHMGVRPDAVVGHSQGEIAAAHVAGALSLDDAARIVAQRAEVLASLAGAGGLVSTNLSSAQAETMLERWPGSLDVAAFNGPSQTVVSGDGRALEELLQVCAASGIKAQRVPIDYASHSGVVAAVKDQLMDVFSGITPQHGRAGFYSTVTAAKIDTSTLGPDYWYANLRRPVRFDQAIKALARDGHGVFVECGAQPVLKMPLNESLEGVAEDPLVVGTLKRGTEGPLEFVRSAARLWANGIDVNWQGLFETDTPRRVPLPTYAFQRRHFWLDLAPGPAANPPENPIAEPAAAQEPEPEPEPESWAERLQIMLPADRTPALLELVRQHVAAVLGYEDGEQIDADRPFTDLGFDSPTAVEFRDRLAAVTDMRLPAALIYNHPTPLALAAHLHEGILGRSAALTETSGAAETSDAAEPIAIIGMGCRLPGGVSSPAELWDLVAGGEDGTSEFPRGRGWDLDGHDTCRVRRGGFLHDADQFDPAFFGISPREATAMDPQQRIMLEISWEAFERAGIPPASLRGSATGVFIGAMQQEYGPRLQDAPEDVAGLLLTGTSASVMSGRIAYTFGFEGPAVTIDTACSSSLAAAHLAVQALRLQECSVALVGGGTVMSAPGMFTEFARQGGLAPDGRCKPFAAAADGTAWAEGAGVVLLERLSDAQANRHPVLAVIRGSAMHQDGASNGLTAPNGPAQERVIRAALANAGLTAQEIDAVEAHGTGTVLGDPIEADAIIATYGAGRPPGQPVYVGSLKSNIGHAQAAAGIAAVIKMAEAIGHRYLPKSLHVDEPTPQVDWTAGSVELLTDGRAWPDRARPHRAGISSFGISGTNVHLILEAPAKTDETEPEAEHATRPPIIPFAVSAKSERALREQGERLLAAMTREELDPVSVGRSLARGRTVFEHRAVVLGHGKEELLEGLRHLAAGAATANVIGGKAGRPGKIAFVFPGQGSQYIGMARGLLETSAIFRENILACGAALEPYLDRPPAQLLSVADDAALERVDIVQPALFAVMVSLAGLWRAHGIEPDAVAGHSQGEIAAAHIAGVLSLDDAARIVAARSRALRDLSGSGAMAAVNLPAEETDRLLRRWEDGVSVAAINSPSATVVSGEPEPVRELLRLCEDEGIRAHRLPVDFASHSAAVERVRDRILRDLAKIEPKPGGIPVYSGLRAGVVEASRLDAAYWYDSLRGTVRFADATQALLDDGHHALLEVSPHPVLVPAMEQTAEQRLGEGEAERVFVGGTLHRDEEDLLQFAKSLARVHAHHSPADWGAFFGEHGGSVELPTYPFERRSYWLDSAPAADVDAAGLHTPDHPLLSAVLDVPDGSRTVFTGQLSQTTYPWLADHGVHGTIVVPGTAFADMALHAADQTGCRAVTELTLREPLVIPAEGAVDVQIAVHPSDGGQRSFTVHARPRTTETIEPEPPWRLCADGRLAADTAPADTAPAVPAPPWEAWPPPDAQPVEMEGIYERLADRGYHYGPLFRGVTAIWRHGSDLYADIELPGDTTTTGYGIHPALLDAVLHPLISGDAPSEPEQPLRVPFAFETITLHATGATRLRVRLTRAEADTVAIYATDPADQPVVTIESLSLRPIEPEALSLRGPERHRDLLHVTWERVSARPAAEPERPLPETMTWQVPKPPANEAADVPAAVRKVCQEGLKLLQDWLTAPETADDHMLIITRNAVNATRDDPPPDLAHAALWGLVRTAQNEHPHRVTLLDIDGAESVTGLTALLRRLRPGSENQYALRDDTLYTPRLAPAPQAEAEESIALDAEGTVLITGGTGTLGGLLARHLVTEHGVRRLVLTSRSGMAADGAAGLRSELAGLGADVTIAACDTADRSELAAILDSVPAEHPLTAVVHAAGVLSDASLTNLTAEHLDEVLRPKVDAAWHLHELTRHMDLAAFVLYSSAVAGTLGTPGQGNYAAANTFLDALAHSRHHLGLTATSLAWGYWQIPTGMTGHLTSADTSRLKRLGMNPLSTEHALALFDLALASGHAALVPMTVDVGDLRRQPDENVPPILRELVPALRPVATTGETEPDLAAHLVRLSPERQFRHLLTLVQTQATAVLGLPDSDTPAADQTFKDLGIDSLTALELRKRLAAEAGLNLPATLVFDHPTPTALAQYLHQRLSDAKPDNGRVDDDESAAHGDEPASASPIDDLDVNDLVRLALGSDDDEIR
ncbi:type I polyketide synthase [Spirillospora sp. NPDC048911]|uniref:type I polyketide synthase n=1 Tax=Spirillospora sp. NPDC048911 TaxID=3364527 RepID=UPI00372091E1